MTLEARKLVAGYGDKSILEEVSFTLEDGEILAFFGHNGAGKSTTLKAVIGLIETRGGEILLDGERIDQLPIGQRLERGLRLLPERRGVFPDLSVEESIDVVAQRNCSRDGCKITRSDVYDLLPVLRERRKVIAGEMSGGQQQMLAFALALLGSPRCILLEEPSVGLQPDLVEELFAKIREICGRLSISAILIEHKIASAMKIANHVIIINSGRLVFSGPKTEAEKINLWNYF
ncbi:ATP-binding cassette domain-containing protein [Chelatococcus asaccharovorans]|uniref:Branched-chain amino acid transport system ATP-binding protein n=1 Tax=Chelatococcus asaccharovorans TaxID=28210 RepID=A0A2V3TZC2_9HYPH|nr:ATP-binding cassette domain-containing protein [Chelatococcus asaccharovorans]MBS7707481.1 ATP-binding cassette domain-containing protein [Chelatococcus asaccharovorans]PXW54199.1 branched-chain amino acid transport system ATP-binding protein [Chelatococcus asaccharovorans]